MSSVPFKWPASQQRQDSQQVSPLSQAGHQIVLPQLLQMCLGAAGYYSLTPSTDPTPTWDQATLLGTQVACWLQQLVQD